MALTPHMNGGFDMDTVLSPAASHSNGHRVNNNNSAGALARNKRKNFKPRNILPSEDDDEHMDEEDDNRTVSSGKTDGCDDQEESGSRQSSPAASETDKWSQKAELRNCGIGSSVPGIKRALMKTKSGLNCIEYLRSQENIIKHNHPVIEQHQQQLPLDLSQSECRSSPPAASSAPVALAAATKLPVRPVPKTRTPSPARTSLGVWRPTLVSGIAPWIDPSFLSETGTILFLFLLCCYIFLVLVILCRRQKAREGESERLLRGIH